MKNKLLLCFSLYSYFIISQTDKLVWAPVGAKWEYNIGTLSGNSTCAIYVEKDTIIQDKRCKKIANTCSLPSYAKNYYLYIKNKDTIEYLLKDTFAVLYDFTKKKGDTVSIQAFNPFDSKTDECNSNAIFRIKEFDEYPIGKFLIRNYYADSPSFPCSMYVGNYVFEVFGPFLGYLFPMNYLDEIRYSLNRYSDSCWDIEPKLNLEDPNKISYTIKINKSCLISATQESTLQNRILIFPNPAVSHINISNSTGYKIDAIKIMDNLGRILINSIGNITSINTQNILPGLYYVKINIRNVIITKPLIITKGM